MRLVTPEREAQIRALLTPVRGLIAPSALRDAIALLDAERHDVDCLALAIGLANEHEGHVQRATIDELVLEAFDLRRRAGERLDAALRAGHAESKLRRVRRVYWRVELTGGGLCDNTIHVDSRRRYRALAANVRDNPGRVCRVVRVTVFAKERGAS